MKNKPIYVEIDIKTSMDNLWEASQNPSLHEQWDLRFSSITYLPKKENKPQHFEYKTNIGFGMSIAGWGKSVGSFHSKDGSRTSSLHFGTDQIISPIKKGKGYWKYEPRQDSIKFYTQYDYDIRFGLIGKFFDLVFRPIMGWATALSFDVLKRWLEKNDSPSAQYVRFFSHWMITFLFFFIWTYHGLVPKLILAHPLERSMFQSTFPIAESSTYFLVYLIGMIEIIFGVVWLVYKHKKQLFYLQLLLFPLLTLSVIWSDPVILGNPFSPLTFNISLFVLSIIGIVVSKDIPSAKSCKRYR